MVSNKETVGVSFFSINPSKESSKKKGKGKAKGKASAKDNEPVVNQQSQQADQPGPNNNTLVSALEPSHSIPLRFEPVMTPQKRGRDDDAGPADLEQPASGPQGRNSRISGGNENPGLGASPLKRVKKDESYKAKQQHTLPVLRMNRPIQADIHEDIWARIFTYCRPRTLVMLRTVNKRFNDLLNRYPHIWRQSRMEAFGADCPPVPTNFFPADRLSQPDGLSESDWEARQTCFQEMQYSELIDGFGCHGTGCGENSRKVYWLFQRRFCEKCLMKRLSSGKSLSTMAERSNEVRTILACLPHCSIDSWGRYHKIAPRRNPAEDLGYDTNAFRAAYHHVQSLRRAGNRDELAIWINSGRERALVKMAEMAKLEEFFEKIRKGKKATNAELRRRRIEYFQKQALEMEHPLRPEILHRISAFKTAIASPREPSSICWAQLRPKLEEQRALAEEVAAEKARAPDFPRASEVQKYDAFRMRRSDQLEPPEELVVLYVVADDVMNDVWRRYSPKKISSRDAVAIMLKEIRKRYQSPPPPPGEPPYKLLIDDARNVLELKIKPFFESLGRPMSEPTDRVYRCPVCGGKGKGVSMAFDELVLHISNFHSEMTTGGFASWRRSRASNHKSPWHQIEWPHNLPLITDRRKVTGSWDLDSREDHHWSPSDQQDRDPFQDRTTASVASRGFVDDTIHALDSLLPVKLDDPHKWHIAFKFAVERARHENGRILDLDELRTKLPFDLAISLQQKLLLGDHRGAFGKVKCGSCPPAVRNGVRSMSRAMPLGELIKHYRDRVGHPRHEWFEQLFRFPSLEDLAGALDKDSETSRVFNELFPHQSDSQTLIRSSSPVHRSVASAPVAPKPVTMMFRLQSSEDGMSKSSRRAE